MTKSRVGPWAIDKLDRLRKYLSAYTTIMKDQRWCAGYYYIDAFAGPAICTQRKKDVDLTWKCLYDSNSLFRSVFRLRVPRLGNSFLHL